MPDARGVFVDTGPLVALFDPSDRVHASCRVALGRLRQARLVTSLAVLTEATFLLAFSTRAQCALLRFVASGAVEVGETAAEDAEALAALMDRYRDLPMDFADATLVWLAPKLRAQTVLTLDRRGFGVYRNGRRTFRVLP